MPAKIIYRQDYQPPNFIVDTIALDFDLYDDHVLVASRLQLKRQYEGALHLYGEQLELVSLHLNGEPLNKSEYDLRKKELIINSCPDELRLDLVARIFPQHNTQLSGLYLSRNLFSTQCEAEGFRRITFYPDRPDVLAKFTTRIAADKKKYPQLLSNGDLIDSGNLDEGRHWVLWQDPFKKPSYLFALVAGKLACVEDQFITSSGKTVELRIYVEIGNEDKCSHAMESLKKAMRWDEEVYGREYDLHTYMIVAVRDFNMGAMENKGLNIFNDKYILARPDTATDDDFLNIQNVVAHEYFHNWTGNRVTCRDWFQLSLKEGLTVFRDQEFSRDMYSPDVIRIDDVNELRTYQFPEDDSSMAHPVRPESYREINNFYTTTVYNKGAELIRMQQTLLGKAGFRRGMDLYFKRHDGQAVTIDDFVAAMEDANHVDLSQFKLWYSQAGTPEIQVTTSYKDGCLRLTMAQSCPPTAECQEKKPFHIPIRLALFAADGQRLPLAYEVLELRKAKQTFSFTGLPGKPIISLLRQFSAPVKIKRKVSRQELLALLRFETDGLAKWDAEQSLALACITKYFNTSPAEWRIPPALLSAYRHILEDESLAHALRAELLICPSFEVVADSLSLIDVDLVEKARDFFRAELGRHLFKHLQKAYQTLWKQEDHSMRAQVFGKRYLRNVCLSLMMKADEVRSLELCQQQFNTARTMTDQIHSLDLLNDCTQLSIREQALTSFYHQWAHDELVLDKWFVIQATSELPNTLSRVKILLNHEKFNIKNPNRVRALIGAFCHFNERNFHAINGNGYAFLGEMLPKIDKLNPQVAAKLATAFTRWRRFDSKRQELMSQQLKHLARLDLSGDVQEVVEKCL
jgi:aminopeptidase N